MRVIARGLKEATWQYALIYKLPQLSKEQNATLASIGMERTNFSVISLI